MVSSHVRVSFMHVERQVVADPGSICSVLAESVGSGVPANRVGNVASSLSFVALHPSLQSGDSDTTYSVGLL